MIPAIALLAVSSVSLHVEEVRGVSTASTAEIIEALASAIEERTGERVTLDASESSGIGVVLIAGITKVRLLVHHAPGRREASIDLPRPGRERALILRAFARELFPEDPSGAAHVSVAPAALEVPSAPAKLHLPSVVAVGVAAISGGVAIAFQLKSASTHDDLSTGVHSPAELEALIDERHRAQVVSTALLIGAAASAVAAVVLEMVID